MGRLSENEHRVERLTRAAALRVHGKGRTPPLDLGMRSEIVRAID
jgi:hypothetical protein